MRTLALDYGTKRVGLALSDELGVIAQPLPFVPAQPCDKLLETIQKLILEKQVGLVLVGMPRNMDGALGPAAQKVESFITGLRSALNVPIRAWDERLTTAQANRTLIDARVRRDKRKEVVDSMAAAILLQSYLDLEGEKPHAE